MEPITRADFQKRTGIPRDVLCRHWGKAKQVVSLREIKDVDLVSDMPRDYIRGLADAIPLSGEPNIFPYRGCKVRVLDIDPATVLVGQRFVQNDKLLNLIGGLRRVFADFPGIRGFSNLTAKIVLGRSANGLPVIAHYLPTIVEEHEDELIALDGMHRQFIVRGVGGTLAAIGIRKVGAPFPCDVHHHREIAMVDAKPPMEQRYFNLKPELFRDLKAVGIDG